MEANHTNGNGETRIRRVLFGEVTLVIALVGVVSSVMLWVMGPQTQNNLAIELLKQQSENQQKVIETVTKTQQNDTQEVKGQIFEAKEQLADLKAEIIKLQTIIDERIPKKK
jgi:hypothetical protein